MPGRLNRHAYDELIDLVADTIRTTPVRIGDTDSAGELIAKLSTRVARHVGVIPPQQPGQSTPALRSLAVVVGTAVRNSIGHATATVNVTAAVAAHLGWCADPTAAELATDQAQEDMPPAVSLATPCDRCSHAYNWHVPGNRCQVGNDTTRCGCLAFVPLREQPEAEQREPAAEMLADLIARCPEHGNRTETWPECRCDAARKAAATMRATSLTADEQPEPEHVSPADAPPRPPLDLNNANTLTWLRSQVRTAIADIVGPGPLGTLIVDRAADAAMHAIAPDTEHQGADVRLPFIYPDPDGDTLRINRYESPDYPDPVVVLAVAHGGGSGGGRVYIPTRHSERIVAAIRAAAR